MTDSHLWIMRPRTAAAAGIVRITAAVPALADFDTGALLAPLDALDLDAQAVWGRELARTMGDGRWMAQAVAPSADGWTHVVRVLIDDADDHRDFLVKATGIPGDADEAALAGFDCGDFEIMMARLAAAAAQADDETLQ